MTTKAAATGYVCLGRGKDKFVFQVSGMAMLEATYQNI